MNRLVTFAGKARARGWPYLQAVTQYQSARLQYQMRRAWQRVRPWDAGLAAQPSSSSRFHFQAEDVEAIVERVPPALRRRAISQAGKVLEQRFSFRGLPPVHFRDQIAWDLAPDGNQSWNWDLNRHHYFLCLGTAYFYTRDARYPEKLIELWLDWAGRARGKRKHVFEVAARLQNWMWAYFLLEASNEAGPLLLRRLRSLMLEHAEFLAAHLEYHWPNNHLLLEAKALYEFVLLFPHFPLCRRVKPAIRALLEQQIREQVLPDGGHSELCSMYHSIVAGELGEIFRLCRRLDEPLSDDARKRVAAMQRFSAAMRRADHSMPLLGDSSHEDTYLRFDSTQRDFSDLNYWLTEEDSPGDEADSICRVFPASGYAFLASRCSSRPVHLTFDFGPLSRCATANHAHCDTLSFDLHADGRPLIADPGFYFPWDGGSDWPEYFRSTQAHNTLVIDDRPQSDMRAGRVHSVRAELLGYREVAGRAEVCAQAIPYWAEGGEVIHRREIVLEKNGSMQIGDQVHGLGRHKLQWYFHLAPELEASLEAGAIVARADGRTVLVLQPRSKVPVDVQLVRGQRRPFLGWFAGSTAVVRPAWTIVISTMADLPVEIEFAILGGGCRDEQQ